jgi:hypothetical protein
MEIQRLERIRFATRHFNDLQGLRYGVPLGLITWGCGIVESHFASRWVAVALFLGAFLLMFNAKRYYWMTFGVVEPQPVDDAAELSVFSPAGPIVRGDGLQQVAPPARYFLVTLALTLALFSTFQMMPPNILVQGNEALGEHPQILPAPPTFLGPPWMKDWPTWRVDGEMRSPSMLRAVFAQTAYVFYGSLFLGLWLWRGRRRSESPQLALALLLLGLAIAGTSLGYLARADGEIDRSFDLILPALVYPGVALFLCGTAMILAGLLDHWQLVQTLGRRCAEA